MIQTYISLGSNQGHTLDNLDYAKSRVLEMEGVYPGKSSGVYFTEPQEVKEQSWFANQVISVLLDADQNPEELLKELLRIEDSMGRVREERFGPRIIDLDLLLFGNMEIETKDLLLPHPRMHQRAFILVPLMDIDPVLSLPSGQRLDGFLAKLDYSISGNKIWQD